MRKITFNNGLDLFYARKTTNTVLIAVCVKVGSNDERKTEKGLSHFIEHMIFEGTKKRTSAISITNEIEKVGGEINALTTNEFTYFYIHIQKKYFKRAAEILSDVVINASFKKRSLEKERKIILQEVNTIKDMPEAHKWVLFNDLIFERYNAKYPVYGSKEIIKAAGREKVFRYYKKNYVPENMFVVVLGNVRNPEDTIRQNFVFQDDDIKKRREMKRPSKSISDQAKKGEGLKKGKSKSIRKNFAQSYILLAWKAVARVHEDSYVFDVIASHLGRGQSGKLFDELRNKRGLAYSLGAASNFYSEDGYFVMYASADKRNILEIEKVFMQICEDIKKINREELEDAKRFIDGKFAIDNEDLQEYCENFCEWFIQTGETEYENYLSNIKRVGLKDISRIIEKYFSIKPFKLIIRQKQ